MTAIVNPVRSTTWPVRVVSRMRLRRLARRRACGRTAIVQKPQREHENRHRHGDGKTGGDGAHLGMVRRVIDRHGQTGADNGRTAKDKIVPVSPDGSLAKAGEQIVYRPIEVDPPHAVHDQQAANDDRRQRAKRFARAQRRLHRDGRREDRLAEHDQRQQAIALSNVMRVPRYLAGDLGPHRNKQLECHEGQKHEQPGV